MDKSGVSEKIPVPEFAKLVGVTPDAVRFAIRTGRLVKSVEIKPNGRHLIDIETGKAEFEDNKQRGARNGQKLQERKSEAESGESESIIEYERKLKRYQAEIARLKYEQQSGDLVGADDIRRQAFKVARAVRDAMFNIPGKISAELAGETDQFKIHSLLEEEIRQALENLSSEIVEDSIETEVELEAAE